MGFTREVSDAETGFRVASSSSYSVSSLATLLLATLLLATLILAIQAQAFGPDGGVAVSAFVEYPIKPGAVRQGAQPAILALVNRPEGQINRPALVVQ